MSESVSYRTRAMLGRSVGTLRSALKRRGVTLAADITWQTARERSEQLERHFRSALADPLNLSLENELSSQARAEITNAVVRSKAMMKSLERASLLQAFAEQKHADELKGLRRELAGMDNALIKAGGESELFKSAANAQSRLEALASGVQQELCQVEKEAILEIVLTALSDLGYLVEKEGNSLKATHKQTCILAEADIFGDLFMDLSGFSGLSCLREMNKIELEFKQRGLVLERTFTKFHGKPGTKEVTNRQDPLFPDFQRIKTSQPVQRPIQWEKTKVGG